MITIYTDGACSNNGSWKGGWGVVVLDENGGISQTLSGYDPHTTNSRMEIEAVLQGLASVEKGNSIEIVTDSIYVAQTINEWLDSWIEKGTYEGKANQDQWDRFLQFRKENAEKDPENIIIRARHIRGHGRGGESQSPTDTYFNDICDKLATSALKAGRGKNGK